MPFFPFSYCLWGELYMYLHICFQARRYLISFTFLSLLLSLLFYTFLPWPRPANRSCLLGLLPYLLKYMETVSQVSSLATFLQPYEYWLLKFQPTISSFGEVSSLSTKAQTYFFFSFYQLYTFFDFCKISKLLFFKKNLH